MDPAIILFGLGVGALVGASSLGLLSKAGLELPAIVLVGVPIVLAVLCFLVLRRRAPLEIGIS